jgi:hypothetical protein
LVVVASNLVGHILLLFPPPGCVLCFSGYELCG